MSKNPFQKYLEATDRQNTNYSYLRAGTPSLGAEYADTTLQPQYTDKTLNDYIGDTAVDATKAAMTLAQTGISTIDAGAYAAEGLIGLARGIGSTVAPNYVAPPDIQEYGQFSKLLNDNLGFNIGKAKQQLGELGYSDIRKKQEAELHTGYSEKEIQDFKDQWTIDFYLQYQDLANKGANPLELEAFKSKFEDNYKQAYTQMMDKYQTSMDKSFGENAAIVGKAFDTVLDNPALAVGAAIESTGYLLPSLAVSRGVAALQGAAKAATATERAIASGIGEGLVSALALNEQMRGNSATGTIDGTKVAAGFAGGGITALIGGVSNRLGSRFGLDDIDSLSLGTQAKGFSVIKPVLATAQEGGEEFLQGFGESIIPNIAEGKDPLQGLAQELALGTAAGGVMGGAFNARSLVSGAGSDLVAGFNKVAEAVGKGKDAITAKTFEELNDPTNKAYDPAKAFNSVVPKLNSQDDRDREEALVNIEKVFTNLETHTSNLNTEKVTAEGILKNIVALPIEEQAQHAQAKNQAQKAIKELEQRIASADKQYMDLFEQKLTLSKNQEVQAGVPQYSEEQAKADIEVLSQQPTTAVWRNQDTDLPVSVLDETQVDEAGQEYTKVSYTDAATGNVSENFVPSSELVQDITTQQEAAERVTKHFSKLSLDELDTVAKSPYLSEEQRNSLRYLSETKRAIADMADTGTVTRHILNGLKGKTAAESHRGLNNYTEMVNTAINTKDEKLLNIALDDLGRFAQDHTDKANALVEAYQLAVSGKFPNLQVLRPKNGTWGIVTDPNKFVDDVKLKATGGLNVHRNSNIKGSIDAVTKEAALIQDSLKALTQVGLSFGLQAVEPAVTPPVTVEALREANKPSSANAVNSTYEQVQVPPTNTALSTYVNHSGGALGSDSAWGDIGAVYGVTSNHYYKDKTPKGNVQITKEQYEEGLLKAKEAAKALGRNWSSKSYIQGLLARNWQQVKNADAIFAIAELEGKYVKGGTGYAVAMAVAENKPIYVFSQSKKSWFRHTGTGWVKTNTPTLTTNFAGIGTRELDAVGVQAIKDVYAKTQQDNKSVTEPEVKVVEPKVEDKPIANKREVRLGLQTRKQELVDLADVNKQSVLESEYADEWQALEALTSPILSDENILDRSDLIVKLASQRNDPAITQFANEILKEAHARVTKDQEKKAAAGQHTSFRKVDDPKRAVHQAKLDESRIFAEESMKKGLQSIDKLEELLQGKKPVSPEVVTPSTEPTNKVDPNGTTTVNKEQVKEPIVETKVQEKPVVKEGDKQAPKVGETSTEVKGRFTITKTVVSDNTVLSVHTNNDNGEVTKSEYATTYSDIFSDELGDKYTLVIYRDSTNPSVITDVKSFDPKDKKNSMGSYGKKGNQTDEKFITTFTEAGDVTLEYTNKFEKSLPVVKPKTPDTSTQTEATASVASKPTKDTTQTVEATTAEGITQFVFERNTHTLATRLIDQWHKAQDVFEDMLKVTSSNLTPSHVSVLTDRLKALIPVQPETWIRFVNVVDSGEGVPESILTKGGNTSIDINGIPIILVNLHNPVPEMDLLETTTHEYVHAVTSKWLIENPKSIEAQRLQQVIDALGEYLKTTEGLDAETIKRATQAQKNIREVIAFGLTNEKVMNVIDALLIEDMQNDTFEQSNEGTREQAVGGGRGVLEASEAREESSNNGRRGHSEKSTEKSSKTGRQVLEEVLQVIVESTLSKENQAEVEDGKITVLQGVTEEVRQEERSKPMSLRDMIVAYFTQSSVKEEGKGANPLVAVKDYILNSNLITQVSNWLSTGYRVSNAQLKQLEHFRDFHSEFREHILFTLQNRKKIKTDNDSDNLVEYLITENVGDLGDTLDENTLTAISLAAYSYLIQYGTKVTNTDEDLRKLLRLEKDTPIPDVTSYLLRNAGQDAFSVARELGGSISASLGLKALKDASTTMQDRLNTAFGLLAVASLHNSKYMYISQLTKSDVNSITADLNLPLDPNDFFNPQDSSFVGLNQLTTISANYKVRGNGSRDVAYKDGKPVLVRGAELEILLKTNENTKGFLSQLFGVSVGFRLPGILTPEKFNQKSIANTTAAIPSAQRKEVEAAQKHSNIMRANTVSVFKNLFGLSKDSKYLKELLGIWVDDAVLAQTHISKHESLRAKAENEWRLVNQGLEWAGYIELGNDEYAEFYDTQSVVQNNRMHIDSNLFSMQSSQIHRAMAAKSAFAVTFNVFENQELLTRFYQGVAEGLEKIERSIKQDILERNPFYKFFTVDKVPAEDFVPAFEKFLSTPESIAAIDAMIALIQTKTINEKQQADIAWFVSKGGMGVQSLQSLIFLAELGIAAQEGGILTTTVSYGSDGINNGVSNANMLLGTASENMRTQTGIISNNSSADSIQDVYAQGINDYYVDFGTYMRNYLENIVNEVFGKIGEEPSQEKQVGKTNKVNALLALFPTFQVEVEDALGMRKISKVWSIPFNYGAGKQALQRALANGFMKGIYDEMERINNSVIGKPRNSIEYAQAIQDRNTLEARINAVITQYTFTNNKAVGFKPIKLGLPENLNTYTFQSEVVKITGTKTATDSMVFSETTLTGKDATYAIESALKTAMTELHGKAAWQATEAFSKNYIDMYSLYLKAQGTSFELYNFIRSNLIQLKLDEKVKANKVEGTYMGLTTEELQEIDNIIGKFKPVVNTPISSKSTNALESGIPLADKAKQLETAAPNREVKSRYFIRGFEGNETPNLNPALVSNQLTDKGTAGMALPIQGMDALVASAVQAKYPILNIHDQASMPIDKATEIIQYQNEVHLQGLITYHLGLENAKTLVNTFKGVLAFINSDSKVLEDTESNTKLLAELADTFKTKIEPKLAEGELTQHKPTGKEVYSYKGLSLKYPDMLLGESTTDLTDAIKTFVITAITNDIKKLNALLETKAIHQYGGEGGAVPVSKKHKQQIQDQLEYLQRQRIALVEALTATVAKDFTVVEEYKSPLLTALENTKGKPMNKGDVLDLLTKKVHRKDNAVVTQEQEVLNAIKDLIPDDLTLVYEEDTYEGQGYYNTETKRIHIKAVTADGAYVDTHLLIHELLHSAVAARLEAIKANPRKYGDANVAMLQLEAIRQEILNLLSKDGVTFTELNTKLNADNVDLTALDAETTALLQAINKEEESLRKQQKELSAKWESSPKQEKNAIREQQAKIKESLIALANERVAKNQTIQDIDAYKKAKANLRNIQIEGLGSGLSLAYKLKNLDEFISYGLSNQALQAYLKGVQLNQNKRSAPERKSKWRRFVEAVTKLVSFRGNNGSNALTAFAVTTAELFESLKGVTPAETNQVLKSEYGASDQVNQMNSIQVMQSLPHTGNSDFGLHLNSLAETVIGQLYNNDEVAKAQIDVIQGLRVLPAIKAGFNLSQREAAVQQALELVLDTYMANTTGGINASQMWKLFKEAQKNIKVENLYDGDWATATPQQRAATQQKFSYLFADNLKGSDALARFVSMALASEEVHNLLGFNTVTAKPSKEKTWFDTFSSWVQYVFAWMGNKLVKTSANDPAYKQLQKLVNNLVALDIRNRQETVALYEKAWNLVGKVTSPLDKAAQTLRQYATNRDFLRNSKYLPLRTLGSIAALDAKAMGETIPKLIRETRDKARPNEKLGEAMNALMESTAMTQIRKAMEALIRQANLNAKKRQDESDNVKKAIMNWFKDNGKNLSKEMHKAITYTLLRTDAQSLLTTFGLNKTIGLLLDTNKLKNEIDLAIKDISQYQNGVDMIHAAEELGYYMISNIGGLGLSKNPTAITIGLGTPYQIDLANVDQALVGKLDVLISLFAMKYTSAKDRKVLGTMYQENPEALEGLLQMHKGFMTDAATEFKDNPLNYVKGWMPELVNPYREMATADNPTQRDQMLKEGWKLIEEIKPHGKFLMVHYDIGYQRLVSGAVDLQNSHRKGTEIVNNQSKDYLSTVKANLAYTKHRASIPLGKFDPTKKEAGLIPAYDTDGVPMGFNYEMASWVRDKEMERNNNFADLMGAYAGAMFYKPAKRNQSVTVANVLFEDFKQNYQKNPNSYIKLSGKSSDPKIVEMWRMLPKDFRQRATELYGKGEPIIINNEAFLLAFGFKKWTITSIWDKPADQRTKMETMFVTMAESILGDTAKARIAKGGHIWAEVVSKAKDFIVIRSIDVLWNNVLANGLMLMAYGINPFTIAKDWAFITANVRSYQKLHSELIQLKANMVAGKGNDALERQIKAIEKQLEANPMNRYINEGLLSSIVEDVTIQQGDYSYDSELKKKIDGVTGWLPDSVKTIGAWAVLSPSTQGYQFLATTTQLSDFVAKVTLAKHLESKGMDFKAAVSEASQTFINYDVPQGVGMQYMNDIGLFMFTKFFLRIQAVLFKLMDKKAATVLAQHIATESLTDMQGILDPMALARIGNWPFEEGAASIIGAAMSIAPVNAGLGLVGM